MRGEEVRRNRSVLLARWRGAGATGPASREPALVFPSDDARSRGTPAYFAPSARDELALLQELEAEIRRAVPRATADTLCRILAAPRAGASELTEEIRAALLSQLDLVEDVLDAVLLTGGPAGHAETEREPP